MKHVLVFDEDPEVCGSIGRALTRDGLGAEIACTAPAAWRRICSLPTLDAVVIDITSGNTGHGFEVAEFARQVVPEIIVVYIARDAYGTCEIAHSFPDGELISSNSLLPNLTDIGLHPRSLKVA